ncbi:MAG: zinc ribbon domain-containing protein [Nitrososphaerota archaeon]|nr:zinc ribbon domain-containing protein [Nitrososphaerota archaeon]
MDGELISMPIFGGNKKTKFDANQPPPEFAQNPRNYSFVHNFQVFFKKSSLQIIEDKVDISITSKYPQLPPSHWVTDRFNQRRHYGSFHITNIKYKESFAFSYGVDSNTAGRRSPTSTAQVVVNSSGFKFCTKCGARLSAASKFCNSCGASQT